MLEKFLKGLFEKPLKIGIIVRKYPINDALSSGAYMSTYHIARNIASTVSLMTAPRVIIFIVNLLFLADFNTVFSCEQFSFEPDVDCWLSTSILY